MSLLKKIEINIPHNTFRDMNLFLDLFRNVSKRSGDNLLIMDKSDASFLPELRIKSENDINNPNIKFISEDDSHSLTLTEYKNSWDSPNEYLHIDLGEIISRFKSNSIEIIACDHLGINIPVKEGYSREFINLSDYLKSKTALHNFPDNDNWKFIIPANSSEINLSNNLDYEIDRYPKFEIVNFHKCSTPIIQIDVATNSRFETLKEIFPEAIHSSSLKNLWVYLENNSGSDICLVLGEKGNGWTNFFKNQRIK